VLVDKYLDRADELDVDALCDKDGNVVISGIMQHIEQVCSLTQRVTGGLQLTSRQADTSVRCCMWAGWHLACRTCLGRLPVANGRHPVTILIIHSC
jgi:hypothetical protein